MKVYHSIEEFNKLKKAIVTTGTFDGVHLGHQAILNHLTKLSKNCGGESVLISFFPHPRITLQKDTNLKLLNTINEKIALLKKTGIDHLLIIPFTKEFSRISSTEFIRDILINKIGTKKLVVGYDHQFGRNREGEYKNLSELSHIYDFDIEKIPARNIDNISVSSTKIRKALNNGDVKIANEYLGSPYQISGTVCQGNKLGAKIGFPTANIATGDVYKLIPKDGVYAVYVYVNNHSYKGMLNIGKRPTVYGNTKTIEVHIIDFSDNIYNSDIKILFIKRIRDEKKFESIDTLKNQLHKDKKNVLDILL